MTSNTTIKKYSLRYDANALTERLKRSDADALAAFRLAGVASSLIEEAERTGRESKNGAPCPVCGGNDRFSIIRVRDGGHYGAYCRKCARVYSPLSLLIKAEQLDFNKAVRKIVDALDGPTIANPAPRSFGDRKDDRNDDRQPVEAFGAIQPPPTRSKHGRRIVPESNATRRNIDYIYKDERGEPVFKVVRREYYERGERVAIDRGGKTIEKEIYSNVWNATARTWEPSRGLERSKIPPYNLDAIAAPSCQVVYIVEGEKAADALNIALKGWNGERVATTTGAASNANFWGNWARCLTGKIVIICADHDDPGRECARKIAAIAAPVAVGVRIVDFMERPGGGNAFEGYDVADYLEDLEKLDPVIIERGEAWQRLDAIAEPFEPLDRNGDRNETTGTTTGTKTANPAPRSVGNRQPADAFDVGDDRAEEVDTIDPIERRRRREERELERNDKIETLLTLPPFPEESLPRSLLDYAQFFARKFNAPTSTAVKQALANFSGLVARLYNMTAPAVGYTQNRPLRPNLSVLTIADSGAGKTPLFDAIFEPIAELQRAIEEEHARRIAQRVEDLEQQEAAKIEKKKLLSKLKRTEDETIKAEIETRLDALDEIIFQEIKEPKPQQELFIDPETPEGTIEAIEINLLSGYTNAPIIATDEGITLFSATYNPRGTLAGFKKYSKAEDGSRFKVKLKTKKASGDNSNPEARLAAFNVGIQPEVLTECFNTDALRRQGFLNRFLFDEQTPNFNAPITDEPLSDETRERFFKPFKEALKTCAHYESKPDDRPEEFEDVRILPSFTYRLDETAGTPANPSALDLFRAFREYCRDKQAYFHKHGQKTLVSFYSKLQKIVLKYAVLIRTWEAFERVPGAYYPNGKERAFPAPIIDAPLMRRAVSLAKWDGLKREALEAVLLIGAVDGGAVLPVPSQKILERLTEAGRALTKSELVDGIRGLKGKKNARKFTLAVKRLIEDGLIKEEAETIGNNTRTLYRYIELDGATIADEAEEEDAE